MHALRICLIASCIATCTAVLPALAQQNQRTAEPPPPPRLEKLEEGEAADVTARPPAKTVITEERAPGGKRTEVQVNTGNSRYYVKPNDQPGTAQFGDAQSMASKPAQWEILRFELRRPKQNQQELAGQAVPAPPALSPTPAAPAPTNK